MKNLWYCVIPTLIFAVIFTIVAIVVFIKNKKKFWYVVILFVIFALSSMVLTFPYLEDLRGKELVTMEGEYAKYIGVNGGYGCVKIYFKTENENVYAYISRFVFSDFNLLKGNKYKITYYKNSHAVHSVELINE